MIKEIIQKVERHYCDFEGCNNVVYNSDLENHKIGNKEYCVMHYTEIKKETCKHEYEYELSADGMMEIYQNCKKCEIMVDHFKIDKEKLLPYIGANRKDFEG